MAKAAQSAHIEASLAPVRAESFSLRVATVAVSFFPWLLIASAVTLAALGLDTAALAAGVVGTVSAGPQIIQATRRARAPRPAAPNSGPGA